MRFHLDMEVEKNLRAGMTASEALRTARLAFGGVARFAEEHRDARGPRAIEDALADARYAARTLRRIPGFVAVSTLTLAVAVSLGTLGFTAANAFFYRPMPVPDGENLLAVFTSDFSRRAEPGVAGTLKPGANSYADLTDFAREDESLADIAGESRVMVTLSVNDDVVYAQGAIVTSGYFRVAMVRPAIGRFPAAPDMPALVISHSLWRRSFGADTGMAGRTIRVNGQPFQVAAVAPPEFRGFNRENGVDAWIDGAFAPTLHLRDDFLHNRGSRSFRGFGRLRAGHSLEALNTRLSIVASELFQVYPQAWRDTLGGSRVVTALREQDAHLADVPRAERLLLVAGVVAFGLGLVIIACMNLASMQMARGASRRREIATRLALGAGRGRLIRQLLAEGALLAVPGVGAGVAVSILAARLLGQYRPIPLPSWDLSLDGRALAVIGLGLAATLLVFGLMPALQTVRSAVVADLMGAERPGARGLRVGGLRGGLIAAQVALSVVFTASAGLVAFGLGRHASEVRDDAQAMLVTRLNFLPGAGDSARVEAVLSEATESIRGVSGVRDVSAAAFIPLRGSRMSFQGETRTAGGEMKRRELDGNLLRPGYLRLAGIELVRGRDFEHRDLSGPRVVIVSRLMAEALWPGEDALGKLVRINDQETPAEVIGVTADPAGFTPATDHSFPGLIYLPLAMGPEAQVMLHVRTASARDAVAGQVAEALRRYSRQLVAARPMTLDEYYDSMLMPLRILARGSGVLAGLQFLLAVAGLSGLVAYMTELRRKEIGIRTALGATRASVLGLVMRQGLRLTAIGGVIGLALSGIVARLLADSLAVTPSVVALGMLVAAVVFGAVGTLAMLVPARRALTVEPAVALRVD